MPRNEKLPKVKTSKHKTPAKETALLDTNGQENGNALLLTKVRKLKAKTTKGKNATYQPPVESTLKIEDIAPTLFALPEVGSLKMEAGKPKRTTVKVEKIEEKPTLEATTLWDFPKQSYGKTPKGNTIDINYDMQLPRPRFLPQRTDCSVARVLHCGTLRRRFILECVLL